MNTKILRTKLEEIAIEEYQKIARNSPAILENGELNPAVKIAAYSILKTDKLGIEYWHGFDGSGYCICVLEYHVHGSSLPRTYGYSFQTLKEAEAFLKKTKTKDLRNPFRCCITKEYLGYSSLDELPDAIFEGLELKDLELKKTVIQHQ